MAKSVYFLLLFIFCSCQNEYFEFDKVEHYRINKKYDLDALDEKANENTELISEDFVPSFDNKLEDNLKPFYYQKSSINSENLVKLSEIYKSQILGNISATKCLPVYRDILIFKKNNQITGISKICFDCEMDITMDQFRNLYEIDMDRYEELETILSN